jgi:hypothetical protein
MNLSPDNADEQRISDDYETKGGGKTKTRFGGR